MTGEPVNHIERLSYSPLPWETHPIDTVHGPNGWGPFNGPWTPVDYRDPARSMAENGIDTTWLSGSNPNVFAPVYDIVSLMNDPSVDRVNNTLAQLATQSDNTPVSRSYSSTISNNTDPQDAGSTSKAQAGATIGSLASRIAAAIKGAR